MSDREKLIELLANDAGCATLGIDSCEACKHRYDEHCYTLALVDHLISNGVTVQKWIPVSERLPVGADGISLCDTVVAYLDNGEVNAQVCVGWLNGDKWYLTVGEDDDYTVWGVGAVTHWMPLPEPPKECE